MVVLVGGTRFGGVTRSRRGATVPAGRAGLLLALVPAFTLVVDWLTVQRLDGLQLAGAAVVIVAVALVIAADAGGHARHEARGRAEQGRSADR